MSGAQHQRRVAQVAPQPAGVAPPGLGAGAEQHPLVRRRAKGGQHPGNECAACASCRARRLRRAAGSSRPGPSAGPANAVRHHVPSDMGELGFHTLSMWWNRSGSPRSSTRHTGRRAGRAARSDTPRRRAALKVAGAASSPSAATRNSPVVRLLNSMSSATSPCQLGALVTSPAGVAGGRARDVDSMFISALISRPTEEQRGEQDRDRQQHGQDRSEVIPLHVRATG